MCAVCTCSTFTKLFQRNQIPCRGKAAYMTVYLALFCSIHSKHLKIIIFIFYFLHMRSKATFSRDVLWPQFLLDQNSVRLSRVVFRSLRAPLTAQTSWIKGTKLPFTRSQFSGSEDSTSPSLKWHFLSTESSAIPTLPAVPAKIQGT